MARHASAAGRVKDLIVKHRTELNRVFNGTGFNLTRTVSREAGRTMGSISTPDMLWVLGGMWLLGVMVPTKSQHRGLVLLLLTSASVFLGITLCLGYTAQPFKPFF